MGDAVGSELGFGGSRLEVGLSDGALRPNGLEATLLGDKLIDLLLELGQQLIVATALIVEVVIGVRFNSCKALLEQGDLRVQVLDLGSVIHLHRHRSSFVRRRGGRWSSRGSRERHGSKELFLEVLSALEHEGLRIPWSLARPDVSAQNCSDLRLGGRAERGLTLATDARFPFFVQLDPMRSGD